MLCYRLISLDAIIGRKPLAERRTSQSTSRDRRLVPGFASRKLHNYRVAASCCRPQVWSRGQTRTSSPEIQKMTSSAMLVAWSPMRSRLRAISRAFSACSVISGCCRMAVLRERKASRFHFVYLVIKAQDSFGFHRIALDERVQRPPDHGRSELRDPWDVNGDFHLRSGHFTCAAGDADGLISDALQVLVNAQHCED